MKTITPSQAEIKLTEMAGTIDLQKDVLSAFAEMDIQDALEAIERRCRDTRSFIKAMEDVCYEARRP
jgi:acyl CoA:acetate/3-ketoacid CoA transferase